MSGTKEAALERLQEVLSGLKMDGHLPEEKARIERQSGAVREAMEAISAGRREVALALKPFERNLAFIEMAPGDTSVRMVYGIAPKDPARDHVLNFIFEGTKVMVVSRAMSERRNFDVNEFDVSAAIDAFALYLKGLFDL